MKRKKLVYILVLMIFLVGLNSLQGTNTSDEIANNTYLIDDFKIGFETNTQKIKSDYNNFNITNGNKGLGIEKSCFSSKDEYIDQQQTTHGGSGLHVNYGQYVAQSFTPSIPRLSKVYLMLFKYNGDPFYDFEFYIRSGLTGSNLVTITKTANEIMNGWNEFDFPDMEVDVENLYYIVCEGDGGAGGDPIYLWYCSDTNPYDRGMVHIYSYGSWHNSPAYDCCFKTAYTNENPNTPSISGPGSGTAGENYVYSVISTDDDGDDLFYYFDWGDETNSSWLGPYNSGVSVSQSHIWQEEGTYLIQVKAKDICSGESAWGSLEVTMPKSQMKTNKNIYPILHNIIERCLMIRQLIRL